MIQLRDYQRPIVDKAKEILSRNNIVYLAAEVRTGKTFMSFAIGYELGWRNILMVTKKNAIEDIMKNYLTVSHLFRLTVINYEQVHKYVKMMGYDGFIIDEAHSMGAFPKPSQRTQFVKALVGAKPVILMSGTPTPESPSQIYHQFWVSPFSPFRHLVSFYKFAHEFVDIKKKFVNGFFVNDYTHAREDEIKVFTAPLTVSLSQVEAGFTSFVEEEILEVVIDNRLYTLMKILKKDKVYKMKSGHTLLADTPVKLQSMMHQISSGTIKVDETTRQVLDESKAWFIKTKFAGQKIAIFYKFIAEGELLRRVFPYNTESSIEFNKNDHLVFIKQMVSGREGTDLSTADALIAYNIDFSATTYWQMRARPQSFTRTKACKIYWIFSQRGLERFVYKAVVAKKNFTLEYFRQAAKQLMLA